MTAPECGAAAHIPADTQGQRNKVAGISGLMHAQQGSEISASALHSLHSSILTWADDGRAAGLHYQSARLNLQAGEHGTPIVTIPVNSPSEQKGRFRPDFELENRSPC